MLQANALPLSCNHWDSGYCRFNMSPFKGCLENPGIEPGTFRMQSGRATTVPIPLRGLYGFRTIFECYQKILLAPLHRDTALTAKVLPRFELRLTESGSAVITNYTIGPTDFDFCF